MRLDRTYRTFASWIVGVSILVGALAPTLAQSWPGAAGATWLQVCTSLGTKLVKLDTTGVPTSPLPAPDQMHAQCPYCSLHASGAILSPVVWVALAALLFLFEVPRPALAVLRQRLSWVAPQSRGPPQAA
jgi:hypothetical protein